MNQSTALLPIGTRVFHTGHGYGRIIDYNQRKPLPSAEIESAAVLARNLGNDAQSRAVGQIVAGALSNSLYDGQRCPYRIRFDPNPRFFEKEPRMLKRFPNQCYEDLYERASFEVVE